MRVFVLGNPDLAMDSLPIKLLPELREARPDIVFTIQDPNDDWDTSESFWVIDTVVGLPEITVFNSLDAFQKTPRVSMHDFDALTYLRFLKKLGKLPPITIIGIPSDKTETEVLPTILTLLPSSRPS
jgi:Ni,Fe-hydrogenase maturation factor